MFSGIGAQHKALKNLARKNKINFEIVGTSEWDINAIISYDSIHNGSIKEKDLDKIFDFFWLKSKEKNINEYFTKFIFSKDGKTPFWKFTSLDEKTKKRLFIANIRTKNFGDIKSLKNKIIPYCDILTYSFPCQDLSIASMGRQKGMEKNSGTRSGLLWEVEEILKKYLERKLLPKVLILENVGNMLSKKFKPQYDEWVEALNKLGYETCTIEDGLDARDFKIPQKRKRIFAISYLKNLKKNIFLNDFKKSKTNFDKKMLFKKFLIGSNYIDEAEKCRVKLTPSRLKMIKLNPIWTSGENVKNGYVIPTITTKQDRHPNCGFIKEDNWFRFLTPRETFLLMGFENNDFDRIIDDCCGPKNSVLYKQSGNSIVVPILENIFKKIWSEKIC